MEMCPSDVGNTSITGSNNCSNENIGAYIIMICSSIIVAIGASGLFTVATAYLDEIVHPKYLSVYITIYLIPSIVGPGIGFGVGSAFLTIYVDPWYTPDPEATWIGAWWLGHAVFGIISICFSVPFLLFPKWLPDSHIIKAERAKEMAKIYPKKYANEDSLTIVCKMFPVHIKRLLTNVPFMLLCFGIAAANLAKDGFVTFGPKYVETVFRVSPSLGGFLAGGIGLTTASKSLPCAM